MQWSVEAKSEEQEGGSESLLETVGLELMAEGVRAGTHLESWRERVPDCRSCDAETAGAKCCLLYTSDAADE